MAKSEDQLEKDRVEAVKKQAEADQQRELARRKAHLDNAKTQPSILGRADASTD